MLNIPVTIKREGIIDPKDLEITITPAAARQFDHLYGQQDGSKWLCVKIEKGGCAGFKMVIEYRKIPMTLDNHADYVIDCEYHDTLIVMDAVSASKINGSTIDYVTNVLSSQFVVSNPDNPCCGCGASFG